MDEQSENLRDIPSEYQPISMWGYLGYELLFSIPLIGFILLLVFSFGGTKNKNLKNFARSYLCLIILAIIFAALISKIYIAPGIDAYNSASNVLMN